MAGTVDVEGDAFFLKSVLEDAGYPEIAQLIKKAFDTVIPRKAIDFRTNIAKIINQCLAMHGVPMFRTTYAKQPFPMHSVLMVCYGSHDGKMRGVWFKETPTEDMDLLKAHDGYMHMLRKYGKGAQPLPAVPEAAYGGVVFAGSGQGKPTALEQSIKAIREELEAALADEEKAVPFYETLKNGIEGTLKLIPREDEKFRYLYSTKTLVEAILFDETKHRERLKNMIKSTQELERALEMERTTGRPQILSPLWAVGYREGF